MLDLFKSTIVRIISFNLTHDWYAPFRSPFEQESVGTGFFIDSNGTILTCAHVIEDSMKLEITIPSLGKKRYSAKVISLSNEYDIAVIKADFQNEKYLEIDDSDKLKQGDEVQAIGYSLGTDKVKLTKGIVSGYQSHLIQTDAAINPGNSGGPLLNKDNKVLAINSQKISSMVADNVGYSVPINLFIYLKDKFLNDEKKETPVVVKKPILMCHFSKIDDYIKKYYKLSDDNGILITKLEEESILYKNGIRQYDILISFDKYNIDNYGETSVSWNNEKFTIADLLYRYPIGKTVPVTFFNLKNGRQTIDIKLEYPNFKINYEYLTIKNKVIDYEILSGMIFSNLTENHLTGDQLLGTDVDKNDKIKLLSYTENENKFEDKLFLVSILPGSYISSNCDLSAGVLLEEVNDKKISNLDELRSNLIENGTDYIKFKFSNCKIIIIDKENILNEHKILSEKYMYETSTFLKKYLSIYDIRYHNESTNKEVNNKPVSKEAKNTKDIKLGTSKSSFKENLFKINANYI